MDRTLWTRVGIGVFALASIAGVLFSFPAILEHQLAVEHAQAVLAMRQEFPVTVNPQDRTIIEDERVNAFLESPSSPLQAATANVGSVVQQIFDWVAVTVANASWYQSLAGVDSRLVTITSGMRKEQVANAFGQALGWNAAKKKEFLTRDPYAALPLSEGSFTAGIYTLTKDMTPRQAQALVNDRFSQNILSHYSTTTAQIVPLGQALTIASLIEREAGGADDMRLISGVIWNRLFIDMKLQIDATLQYAKASVTTANGWWPKVVPADLRRKSAYNTYQNVGLPPTPIASPSVASVLAALNPKKTDCLFYFHDENQRFHCSETYKEHVALLKQYYGRGK